MTQMAKVVSDSKGMPMVSAGGKIMMTVHQVNGDGAGPYTCMIDSSGTGTGGWTKMEVETNVPGKNSRSRAKAEEFVCGLCKMLDDIIKLTFYFSP